MLYGFQGLSAFSHSSCVGRNPSQVTTFHKHHVTSFLKKADTPQKAKTLC